MSAAGARPRRAVGRIAGMLADEGLARALTASALVALPALALYVLTLLPDVDFWDTAEFQAVGPVLGIAHPTGYPTYTLLLWLASVVFTPLGGEALRANLLSAVVVAAGCGVLGAVAASLTRRLLLGVAAGAALAVTPEAWAVAVRADPHALHLLFVCLLLALLVAWQRRLERGVRADRWLLAAAVVFGLSLGNHALTVLLAPGIALFVFAVAPRMLLDRPRFAARCIGAAMLATVAVYAYLPLRSAMDPPLDYGNPQTLDGLLYVVFAGQFRGSFHGLPPIEEALAEVAGRTVASLGVLAVLIPAGVYEVIVRRRSLFVLLAAWTALSWLFALAYTNADIERYYITPLVCLAVLAALGGATVWSAIARASLLEPRIVRAAAAVVLIVPVLWVMSLRYDRFDASRNTSGRDYLEQALPVFERDAVVVSWWSISTTLWYGQFVEKRRLDVWVVDDSTIDARGLGTGENVIDGYLGRRPVYLIRLPQDMPYFERRYRLTQVMPQVSRGSAIYRVDGLLDDG